VDDFIERLIPHLNIDLRSGDFSRKWGGHHRLAHPMCGSCVPSTQAIFYAFDTEDLIPHRGLDEDGMMHWWMSDRVSGGAVAANATQYTDNGNLPPYQVGASSNWYGWKGRLQIRTLHLLNKIMVDSQMYVVSGDDYTPPGLLPV